MTVLVIVEMFNALNNLSEDGSLLETPPWANGWLLAAIAVSVALHCLIMYVPALSAVFGITHLGWPEWRAVLVLSAPVILLDEAMKAWARRRRRTRGGSGGRRGGGGGLGRRLELAARAVLSRLPFGPALLRVMRRAGGAGEMLVATGGEEDLLDPKGAVAGVEMAPLLVGGGAGDGGGGGSGAGGGSGSGAAAAVAAALAPAATLRQSSALSMAAALAGAGGSGPADPHNLDKTH
jgi:hypothetical protein